VSNLLGIAAPDLVPVPVLRAVAVEALERLGLVDVAAAWQRIDCMDAAEWRYVRTAASVAVAVLEPLDKQKFELATELFQVTEIALERVARSAARRRAVLPGHH
jgi:hypothetical protein